jgi:transcription elongation GreA/GreB family factor
MVFLGAIVVLQDVKTSRTEKYRLVGQLSDDSADDHIEVTGSSPIGVALMKARIGETVRVDLPKGERRFLIVKIEG